MTEPLRHAPRTKRVEAVLSDRFATAHQIALRAGLPTRDRVRMARRCADVLVRAGLAERGGTEENPRWRKAAS